MARRVEVVPYNPDSPGLFKLAADEIAAVFGQEIVAIHHIGSTAVPSIVAKPIIDVMVEVHDIERIDGFNNTMVSRGYEPRGEFGIAGRRFFTKGGEAIRSHHVNVFQTGHPEVRRHLDFRDYLIAHPDEADAYGQLKKDLAKEFPADIERYCAGKAAMIREIDARSQIWRENR